MPFIPVDSVIQVELRYTAGTEEVENTLYFHHPSNWDPVSMASFGSDLILWWDAELKPIQSSALVLREIYLRNLTFAEWYSVTATPIGSGAGTAGGDPLPNNCTLSVSFRTDLVGRNNRGRNYTVGMVESQCIGNVAQSAYISAITSAYTALLTVASAAGAEWVVVSRYTNGSPRVEGTTTPITTVLVTNSVMDSQRRRLPRG